MPRRIYTKVGQARTITSTPRRHLALLPLGILAGCMLIFFPREMEHARRAQSAATIEVSKNISHPTITPSRLVKRHKNCTLHNQDFECGPVYNVGGANQTSYRQALLDAGSGANANDVWNSWLLQGHNNNNKSTYQTQRPNSRTMKLVLMTMNEWPLIAWWTFYHGEMLGFENLYIIDSSSDSRCVNFLKQVKDQYNINVIFSDKDLNGVIGDIYHVMNSISVASDLMIKVDTDEFLAVVPNTPACPDHGSLRIQSTTDLNESCRLTPYGVQEYLDGSSLPLDGSKLKVGFVSYSVPDQETCQSESKPNDPAQLGYSEAAPVDFKVIFDSRTFDWVDLGSHSGATLSPFTDQTPQFTALGMFHLHSRCFPMEIESSRQATIRHGHIGKDDTNDVALAKFRKRLRRGYPTKENNCTEPLVRCPVVSCHKIHQLMQYMLCPEITEQRYYDRPAGSPNAELVKYIQQLKDKYPLPL
ncbi:Protein of unknown function, DUF288 [Seminavis robusta]|uniref:Glycosyltransferase family 92 protein n=1 Tax=Seminavis robusta TaxID=568900 RepID=A0A9N8DI80_9STRA|nr:Protein of unknown function, DUF288 [Seminavis robusta]|eukprot:Sro158_g071650.1 Protein of unknown function, DUF288 (473) ;mRNA; f:70339-71757